VCIASLEEAKGHVITFPSNVQEVAYKLPNLPEDLPIIRLVSAHSDFKSKDFRVLRQKVLSALEWLVHNHPAYCDIVIDCNRISALPEDDFISRFKKISLNDSNNDSVPVDKGPVDSDDLREEISSFLPLNLNILRNKKILFWSKLTALNLNLWVKLHTMNSVQSSLLQWHFLHCFQMVKETLQIWL